MDEIIFQDCGDFLCVFSLNYIDYILDVDDFWIDIWNELEQVVERIPKNSGYGDRVLPVYFDWKKKKDLLTKLDDNSNV